MYVRTSGMGRWLGTVTIPAMPNPPNAVRVPMGVENRPGIAGVPVCHDLIS